MNTSKTIEDLNYGTDTKNSYSLAEVRIILDVTKASVINLVKNNYFKTVKIANEYRIIRNDFDSWLDGGGEL